MDAGSIVRIAPCEGYVYQLIHVFKISVYPVLSLIQFMIPGVSTKLDSFNCIISEDFSVND